MKMSAINMIGQKWLPALIFHIWVEEICSDLYFKYVYLFPLSLISPLNVKILAIIAILCFLLGKT